MKAVCWCGTGRVQVEDVHRDGEDAWLIRAQYTWPKHLGLSAYALYVAGSAPDAPGAYGRGETDFNLQWSPPEGKLKGLMVRLRYGPAKFSSIFRWIGRLTGHNLGT